MSVVDLAAMPSLRSLGEAAEVTGVSRRLLQKWVSDGKLKRWKIEGDRKLYVDLDAIKKLREPKPIDR